MRTRYLGSCAVAVATLLAVAACGSSAKTDTSQPSSSAGGASTSSSGSKAPVKIGVLGSFSGLFSDTSSGDPAAIQAWASATNAAGGLDGHPVKVYVADDGGSASASLSQAKKLVEEDHVIAIVGIVESGLEGTWASYVDSKHIPVIGGEATGAVWLTDANFYPSHLGPINGLIMTAYASKLAGATKYGVAYCAEAPACVQGLTLSKQIAPKAGVTLTGGYSISATAPNYTAQCLQFKNAGTTGIFLALAEPTWVRFMSSCASQGYQPVPVAQDGNYLPALLKDPNFAKLWLASDTFDWATPSAVTKSFFDTMTKYSPKTPIEGATADGWAAATLFQAAAKTLSATPTSDDIYNGLYSLGANFNAGGLIPPVTFAKGKPAAQQPCAAYMAVSNGKLTSPKGTKQICLN
jgi:branched-chain amino acid transport system substrate-binding protein